MSEAQHQSTTIHMQCACIGAGAVFYRPPAEQSVCVQVLQLQSATTQPQSQPVDYQAGIEAMVLAILQQTNVTLVAQQAQLVAMQIEYMNAQDSSAADADVTKLYAAYLAEALAMYSNLTLAIESDILHLSSSSSLLPVSCSSRHLEHVANRL